MQASERLWFEWVLKGDRFDFATGFAADDTAKYGVDEADQPKSHINGDFHLRRGSWNMQALRRGKVLSNGQDTAWLEKRRCSRWD